LFEEDDLTPTICWSSSFAKELFMAVEERRERAVFDEFELVQLVADF
jgi:hypothetical protein